MADQNPLDLAAIQARADAATPGPWEADTEIDGMYAGCKTVVRAVKADPWRSRVVTVGQTRMHISADGADEANVAFIAAARTDVPALLAEIQRLHAEAADTRRRVAEEIATALERNAAEYPIDSDTADVYADAAREAREIGDQP